MCLYQFQTGCHKETLTDFSFFLLYNSLRESNIMTYELEKNKGNWNDLINKYLKKLTPYLLFIF